MRISRRNLSLLVEHLLVEGMSYEEVKKGAPKKILKLYKSYMWKAINEKVDKYIGSKQLLDKYGYMGLPKN